MGFSTFEEARQEYGTNDLFGIWLFPDGEFLSCSNDEDHRAGGDVREWLLMGAISLRISRSGELNIRAQRDVFYPWQMRQQIERLASRVSHINIAFFDEDGYHWRWVEAYRDEIQTAILEITDPIAFRVMESER
jgi:hypothetical protein